VECGAYSYGVSRKEKEIINSARSASLTTFSPAWRDRRGVGGSYTKMTKNKSLYPMPIREWSEDDRPREKLLKYGEHTLNTSVLSALFAPPAPLNREPSGCSTGVEFPPEGGSPFCY